MVKTNTNVVKSFLQMYGKVAVDLEVYYSGDNNTVHIFQNFSVDLISTFISDIKV